MDATTQDTTGPSVIRPWFLPHGVLEPLRASETWSFLCSNKQRKNPYPQAKEPGWLEPQVSSSRFGTRGALPYLLEEGVVQEGAGVRPGEKGEETT